MYRSRTPLEKWLAAVDFLSSTEGVNAAQLAEGIGVSHKTAWLMLRKFRQAIHKAEADRKLTGTVHAGLRALAPSDFFVFLPWKHYKQERVILIGGSIGETGEPALLKMNVVDARHLVPDSKELTPDGARALLAEFAGSGAQTTLLTDSRMCRSPLRDCFQDAKEWLNRLFYGLGTRYLQSYLDEYCYRRNVTARSSSPRDEWMSLCLRHRCGSAA